MQYFSKTRLFFFLFVSICLVLICQTQSYAITGRCDNCHTMHNMQDGNAVDVNGPNNQLLLRTGCLGCHKDSSLLVTLGTSVAPGVYNTNDPNDYLAGGTFGFMDDPTADNKIADTYAHNCNVPGITNNIDEVFEAQGQVPGYNVNGANWNLATNSLTCSGKYGCHGSPTIKGPGNTNPSEDLDAWAGIKGAHHSNRGTARTISSEINTRGGSYRFLVGIAGYEDPNWQHPDSLLDDPNNHNEYKGSTNLTSTDTISSLCARCHGVFHADPNIKSGGRPAEGDSGSPWLRHPTDISLPNDGSLEYASYNFGNGYSVQAPVGRTNPDHVSNAVNPSGTSDDIVTCISCHRAHGSNQPDLLRWDYNAMVAGLSQESDGGCFVCHTGKL